MKKLIVAVFFFVTAIGAVRADEPVQVSDRILWDWGTFKVFVPFKTINAVGLWDFVAKRSMVGGETPVAALNKLQFVAGGVTSLDGQGTPFVGVHFRVLNPTENFVPLASFSPGIFAGRNFRDNAWVFGIKASIGLF